MKLVFIIPRVQPIHRHPQQTAALVVHRLSCGLLLWLQWLYFYWSLLWRW
jgi:hypothetical protein